MPSRRSERGLGLAAALRRDVPTNMRVFGESMLGDTSQITEKDFTEEELASMRSSIIRKRAENRDLEAMYREGKVDTLNLESGEWEPKDFSEELASFDKTRGKTAISYGDYADGIDGEDGGEGSLMKSFTDPEYNVATTLGQYVAFKGDDGKTKIKDVYDWGDIDTSDITREETIRAFMAADNLRQMGNVAARVFKPDIRREVLVDLGIVEE